MKPKKSKPTRKDIFTRFEKFWKKSNFDFKSKKQNLGRKKFKIMLIFIFLIIDSRNMKFKNNLAIPTNEQIANYVGCHVSWVKQIKAKYFGSKSKNLTFEEKQKYQLHLNLTLVYQRIHSWKDVMIVQKEQIEDIDPWKADPCFKINSKKYQNWITWKNKKILRWKFFKWISIQIDNFFEKTLRSKKSEKVKKNFIKCIFKKNEMWHKIGWFWKTIFWFRENLEFVSKKDKIKGLIACW